MEPEEDEVESGADGGAEVESVEDLFADHSADLPDGPGLLDDGDDLDEAPDDSNAPDGPF